MNVLFAAIFIFSFQCSLCQECPSIYLRYSKKHTFCMPKSRTCRVLHSGVDENQAREILDLHNTLRSKVAMGKETRVGGLPQAADMMQMVWDKQLAEIAQKLADQCKRKPDHSDSRRVENFAVGQIIKLNHVKKKSDTVPHWTLLLEKVQNDVAEFLEKNAESSVFDTKEVVFRHFRQMVWSSTWRIGCGFVAYPEKDEYDQLYICNYGPRGNTVDQPIYKTGSPCSSCPTNSCCGKSCARKDYDGLCKMNNNNEAPVYPPNGKYLFYCDFGTRTGDCPKGSIQTDKKWTRINALGGSFLEIILKGGDNSTIQMMNIVRPKKIFCLTAKYRSGPAVYGQTYDNVFNVTYETVKTKPRIMHAELKFPSSRDSQDFIERSIPGWRHPTKIHMKFVVPKKAPKQFFNIQLLTAKEGKCKEDKNKL